MTEVGEAPPWVELEVADTPDVGNIPGPLAAAVVAAWAELGNLPKGKTANAGSYSYAYSDLGDLLEMVRPVLSKHGLALLQPTTRQVGDDVVTIETWLLHESGTFLRWRFTVSAGGSAQAVGSSITYGRRYSAQAALGVASEDDDGQAAAKATPSPKARPKAIRTVKDEQQRRTAHAMSLFAELGITDRDDRLNVTSAILGREVLSWNDTQPVEQNRVISELIHRTEEQADGRAAQWDADHAET